MTKSKRRWQRQRAERRPRNVLMGNTQPSRCQPPGPMDTPTCPLGGDRAVPVFAGKQSSHHRVGLRRERSQETPGREIRKRGCQAPPTQKACKPPLPPSLGLPLWPPPGELTLEAWPSLPARGPRTTSSKSRSATLRTKQSGGGPPIPSGESSLSLPHAQSGQRPLPLRRPGAGLRSISQMALCLLPSS